MALAIPKHYRRTGTDQRSFLPPAPSSALDNAIGRLPSTSRLTRAEKSTHILAVFDVDGTLIPGYQQDPLFARYGIRPSEHWQDVRSLQPQNKWTPGRTRMNPDIVNLQKFLQRIKRARERNPTLPPLTNRLLREMGAQLEERPHVTDLMWTLKSGAMEQGVDLHIAIVTSGYEEVAAGMDVCRTYGPDGKLLVDWVYGHVFAHKPFDRDSNGNCTCGCTMDEDLREITDFTDIVGPDEKWSVTKYLASGYFLGRNREGRGYPEGDWAVPLDRVVYVSDLATSDLPLCYMLGRDNERGGNTIAVVEEGDHDAYARALDLRAEGVVQTITDAYFHPDRGAGRAIRELVRRLSTDIQLIQGARVNRFGYTQPGYHGSDRGREPLREDQIFVAPGSQIWGDIDARKVEQIVDAFAQTGVYVVIDTATSTALKTQSSVKHVGLLIIGEAPRDLPQKLQCINERLRLLDPRFTNGTKLQLNLDFGPIRLSRQPQLTAGARKTFDTLKKAGIPFALDRRSEDAISEPDTRIHVIASRDSRSSIQQALRNRGIDTQALDKGFSLRIDGNRIAFSFIRQTPEEIRRYAEGAASVPSEIGKVPILDGPIPSSTNNTNGRVITPAL